MKSEFPAVTPIRLAGIASRANEDAFCDAFDRASFARDMQLETAVCSLEQGKCLILVETHFLTARVHMTRLSEFVTRSNLSCLQHAMEL